MKILACYANKGGVGKTALAVNLSYALADAGHRVLLCDLDPQGAASFYFRVKPSTKLTESSLFKDFESVSRAIKASGYDNLDILPANVTFRDFDVFLSSMKRSRSRLKQTLKSVGGDFDVIVLDCPPNLSSLSENVFRAADAVLVPIIPTTLSQLTFDQLMAHFQNCNLPAAALHGIFSMVQGTKSLHQDTIVQMRNAYPDTLLATQIPFASDVERMGIHRAPVLVTTPNSAAGKAYRDLAAEVMRRAGV